MCTKYRRMTNLKFVEVDGRQICMEGPDFHVPEITIMKNFLPGISMTGRYLEVTMRSVRQLSMDRRNHQKSNEVSKDF